MKRYGPGGPDDVKRGITGIDWDHVIMLRLWAKGVQMACSFDPDKVIAALRNEPSIETILGPGKMSGKEMWGVDNMISPPIPINEVRGGCNPAPLERTIEGSKLVIAIADVLTGTRYF